MDRQTAFLLALGLLILAAATVSVTGWILFVRDRRGGRPDTVVPPLPSGEERGTLSTDD
jgi:cation transporter-like permease